MRSVFSRAIAARVGAPLRRNRVANPSATVGTGIGIDQVAAASRNRRISVDEGKPFAAAHFIRPAECRFCTECRGCRDRKIIHMHRLPQARGAERQRQQMPPAHEARNRREAAIGSGTIYKRRAEDRQRDAAFDSAAFQHVFARTQARRHLAFARIRRILFAFRAHRTQRDHASQRQLRMALQPRRECIERPQTDHSIRIRPRNIRIGQIAANPAFARRAADGNHPMRGQARQ